MIAFAHNTNRGQRRVRAAAAYRAEIRRAASITPRIESPPVVNTITRAHRVWRGTALVLIAFCCSFLITLLIGNPIAAVILAMAIASAAAAVWR